MSDHIHLLIQTGNVLVSTVMDCLLIGYAVGFNRRHNSGHLLVPEILPIKVFMLCWHKSSAGFHRLFQRQGYEQFLPTLFPAFIDCYR
jgi:hypothetical protein